MTIPGMTSLNKLPSGTTQLKQMKEPIICKLWIQKYPDRVDVNYHEPGSVNSKIPSWWWLTDDKCKYILSCVVHKDNKDLSTSPSNLPAGQSRKGIRENERSSVEKERSTERNNRDVELVQSDISVRTEKYGDVEHRAKQARV